jgi:hypothetical protein
MVEIENAVPQMQVWAPSVQTSYRYATVQTHLSTSNFSHCECESFKAPKEQTVHNKKLHCPNQSTGLSKSININQYPYTWPPHVQTTVHGAAYLVRMRLLLFGVVMSMHRQ